MPTKFQPGDVVRRHWLGCDHEHCTCEQTDQVHKQLGYFKEERIGILQWEEGSPLPEEPGLWLVKPLFGQVIRWNSRSLELLHRS